MKIRGWRHVGVVGLYLLAHLGLGACSPAKEGQEEIEATQQEEGSEGEEAANGENATEENANAANEGEEAKAAGENAAGGANAATEGDLQEIISQMNGQEGAPANAAAPAGDAAVANAAAVPAEGQAVPAAPGVAAGPSLPEMGTKMPYIVQAGDTLARIAKTIYGDESAWNKLAEASGMANPGKIFPGDVIYYQLDQQTLAFATAYEAAQRGEIVVQKGDTLASLAKKVLGNSQNWKSLWRHNDNIENPDRLVVGTTLYYVTTAAVTAALDEVNQMATATVQVNKAEVSKDVTQTENNGMFDHASSEQKLDKISMIDLLVADVVEFV